MRSGVRPWGLTERFTGDRVESPDTPGKGPKRVVRGGPSSGDGHPRTCPDPPSRPRREVIDPPRSTPTFCGPTDVEGFGGATLGPEVLGSLRFVDR